MRRLVRLAAAATLALGTTVAAQRPAAMAPATPGAPTAQPPVAQAPTAQPPVAQPLAAPATAAEAGSELQVMLLTIGPGTAVWERFGHNALWIRDARRGLDVAFNWGMFDFNQPNFLGRFLTGDTRYWMEGFDAQALVAHYAQVENRSVWVQELDLAPAQRQALLEFVMWNAQEEHKFYRYDYYLDNCSTRVRDAIDTVLGGAIRRATANRLTGTTYRWHTRRLTAGDPLVYTGIQLALGRPADREISAWEEGFLPVRLMEHVRSVRVAGPDGASVPLVRAERQLYAAQREPEPTAPPSFLLQYLTAGLALAGALALLARGASEGRRGSAAAFGVVAGMWTLITGLLGTALLLAGTVTRHVFMGRNFNLAAFTPLALILLVLVVGAVGTRLRETRRRWASRGERVAALIAVLGVVAWVGALALGQRSGEMFALGLPTNIGLWWGLRRLSRQPR